MMFRNIGKKNAVILALLLALLCGWYFVFGGSMTNFSDHSKIHQGHLKEIHAGRFTFKVPVAFEPSSYSFAVTPLQQRNKERSSTSSIDIKEIPWKSADHGGEMEKLWKPLQGNNLPRAAEVFAEYHHDGGKVYAENLDASEFFGHTSVSISYLVGGYPYPIESVIALPQGILHLTEWRGVGRGQTPVGWYIEQPAADLFKYYSWRKTQPAQKDTFYTAMGMVVGYPTEKEKASITLNDGSQKISLTVYMDFDSFWQPDPAKDKLPSPIAISVMTKLLGGDLSVLSRGNRRVGGIDFLETISKRRQKSGRSYTLELLARTLPGEPTTADRPMIMIKLLCSWDQRERAIEIWNTVLASFGHVWKPER